MGDAHPGSYPIWVDFHAPITLSPLGRGFWSDVNGRPSLHNIVFLAGSFGNVEEIASNLWLHSMFHPSFPMKVVNEYGLTSNLMGPGMSNFDIYQWNQSLETGFTTLVTSQWTHRVVISANTCAWRQGTVWVTCLPNRWGLVVSLFLLRSSLSRSRVGQRRMLSSLWREPSRQRCLGSRWPIWSWYVCWALVPAHSSVTAPRTRRTGGNGP